MEIALYRQPVLIYNPAAGKFRRNPEGLLQRTIAALKHAGIEPCLLPTATAGHADELARDAVATGADLVVVLGGDGTINEAVQGLANTGVPLAILPGGTANVLAMELCYGSNIERAAQQLAVSKPTPVALGRIASATAEPRYFLLMAGAGLDAKVVEDVNPRLKARTGKFAYYVASLSRFGQSIGQHQVRMRGVTYTCGMALISRVRNYAGDLEICSEASLRHNDFEVVLFEGTNPFRYAWYMLGVRLNRVKKMRGVHSQRTCCIEILSSAPLQADGEFLGRQPVRIEIVPGALNLLLPDGYHPSQAASS